MEDRHRTETDFHLGGSAEGVTGTPENDAYWASLDPRDPAALALNHGPAVRPRPIETHAPNFPAPPCRDESMAGTRMPRIPLVIPAAGFPAVTALLKTWQDKPARALSPGVQARLDAGLNRYDQARKEAADER